LHSVSLLHSKTPLPVAPSDLSLPGLTTLDHIAIAVCQGDLEAQVSLYCAMGFQVKHQEKVYGKDQVQEVLLTLDNDSNSIQLLQPLNDDSPLQKRITKNNGVGGLHHIAWRVQDIYQAFDNFKKQGYQIIDSAPRPGSQGTMVFFIHPRSPNENPLNVLFELVEHPIKQILL